MIFVKRRKCLSIDWMRTAGTESNNTHTLNQSIKGIIPKVNNHILH